MKQTSTRGWFLWGIATVFVFFQFILQMSPGVMTLAWMHDFDTNRSGVSYLSASLYYSYLVLQIPVGLLFDRYGPRKVLTFAACALGIGSLWLALSPDYLNALLARALMGVGCTFAFIGMLCIVSDWFPNRLFAFAVGLSETVAMLGTALGTTLFAYFVTHAGWRYAMGLSAILAFIIMVVVFTSVRNKTLDHPGVVTHRRTVRQQVWCVVKDPQILLAGAFGFASFGIINLFGALWGEPFFMHVYHLPLREATALITLLLVGVASGGPILGGLSTHLGRRKPVLALTLCIEIFLFAILLYVPHLPIGMLFLLTYWIGFFAAGYIVCFAFAKEHAKKSLHGTTMAIVNLITMLSAPVLQSIVGWLLHTHLLGFTTSLTTSFRVSLSVLFVCFVLGLLAVIGMKETHCHPVQHA